MSFNPKNVLDDTYQRFIANPQPNSIVLKANYDVNPYFYDTPLPCRWRSARFVIMIYIGTFGCELVADSAKAIIKPKWIEAAVDAHIRLGFEAAGKRIVGFDVADDGEDANATVSRHGSVVYDCDEWRGEDVIYSADHVCLC